MINQEVSMLSMDEAASARAAREAALPPDPGNQDDTLAALMVRDVVCVPAELALPALAALFLDGGLTGAPVVDEAGKVLGMVSRTDLVRHHYESGSDHQHGDRMTDVA